MLPMLRKSQAKKLNKPSFYSEVINKLNNKIIVIEQIQFNILTDISTKFYSLFT